MNVTDVMRELQSLGTAQNVKIYRRHGVGDNVFGVSFAHLNRLKRQIKVNHPLATELWQTGNSDAMSLATMIADPQAFTSTTADAWLKGVTCDMLGGLFGQLVARSRVGLKKFQAWSKSKRELTQSCAYSLLAAMLRDNADQVPDDVCVEVLSIIENGIHRAPNRARYAMNSGLIAIGVYKTQLRKQALATARRVGVVEVDHGETNCQTPVAEAYILKATERAAARPTKTRGC